MSDGCQIVKPLNDAKFRLLLKITKNPDYWIIPSKEIEIEETLGKGNFGEVHKGTLRGTLVVAIKTLKVKSKNNDKKEEFEQETKIMKTLNHRNVVKMYGIRYVNYNSLFHQRLNLL